MDEAVIDEYNADSTFFLPTEDEEQRKAINDEKAMVSGAKPMFEEILAWFDNEINWANSIDDIDWTASEVDIKAQGLAKARIDKYMTEAKQRLIVLKNEHLEP